MAQSSLTFSSDFNLLYHEKSSRQLWDIWFTESKLDADFRIKDVPVLISAVHQTDYLSYSNLRQNQTFTLINQSELISTTLSFKWKQFTVQPTGSFTFGNKSSKPGAGLLLSAELITGFSVFGEAKLRHRAYTHSWKVEDSRPEFRQWAALTEYKGGFLWKWSPSSHFSGWYQQGSSTISGKSQPFKERGTYHNQDWQLSFKSDFSEFWLLQTDFSFYSGEGQPEWLYKNFPFSGIESGKVKSADANLKVRREITSNWTIGGGLTYRGMSLQSGGLLQSFPFTPAVVALIGDYYFFSIDGKISIPGVAFDATYKAGEKGKAHFSIGWQRARPELKIQTWEPLFLLFGRKNERNTPFSYLYADIVPLKMNFFWKFNEISFGLDASQLVPVNAVKKSKNTSGGSPIGSGGKAKSTKTVWGGTEVKLTAVFDL